MAQWGEAAWFEGKHAKIRVLPHVDTVGVFARITDKSKIDQVQLIEVMRGDEREAHELLVLIATEYVGTLYVNWPL